MSALEPFYTFNQLTNIEKNELTLLEANFFLGICRELKEIFRAQNSEYFKLMKLDFEREDIMLEENFIRFIINDILSTETYSLTGIACYTNTPHDVIYEIAIGRNTNPSYSIVRKIIELHRSVRLDLYNMIIAKIMKNNDNGMMPIE